MDIWRYLGLDTKDARTERVKDNNRHSKIQFVAFCVAAIIIAAIIWL